MTITFFLLFACNTDQKQSDQIDELKKEGDKDSFLIIDEFQQILDTAHVSGSILIYDVQKNEYLSNDFSWCKSGYLPASTFKIVNSIIAIETHIVESDSTMFLWDGEKRALEIWEKDMDFHDAFHLSCVPCYQEIAREIGSERMNFYLKKLQYGSMNVTDENIDRFWLEGDSKITMFQQIDFLKRLYFKKLPIEENTFYMMKKLMVIDENPQFVLSGKTGWALRNNLNIGWFVGYVEKDDNVYFIAVNINPNGKFNMKMFPKIRIQIAMKAFESLGLIHFEN